MKNPVKNLLRRQLFLVTNLQILHYK